MWIFLARATPISSGDGRSASQWIANFVQAIAFGAIHQGGRIHGPHPCAVVLGVVLEPRTFEWRESSRLRLTYTYGIEVAIGNAHTISDSAIFVMAALFARI